MLSKQLRRPVGNFHPAVCIILTFNLLLEFRKGIALLYGSTSFTTNSLDKPHEKVVVFYNLFTKSAEAEGKVRKIVEEQLSLIDPTLHDPTVRITSIGYPLRLADATLGNATYKISHYQEGGEYLTLHKIWSYCQSNPDQNAKVAYLHSKGSFHPSAANERLRQFLTYGALSSECANLPDSCDVCSSRMSPLPHPHTSGNMWLARCDYISKLINPLALKEGKLSDKMNAQNPCRGWGRFFDEHWIHSHPSVKPCDLYAGKEFLWGYNHIPGTPFQKDLQYAPRFNHQTYTFRHWCGSSNQDTLQIEHFVDTRLENYKLLYNLTRLPDDWWGFELLNRSLTTLLD